MKWDAWNFLTAVKDIVTGGGRMADGVTPRDDAGFLVDRFVDLGALRVASSSSGSVSGGMFFGLTAGTGNPGTTDYAATVAVKTSLGTGRVPFPQTAVTGPATALSSTAFQLAAVGTYHITATVHTTEAGQLEFELNGSSVVQSTSTNQNPTSGGHVHVIEALVTTTVANSILAVINPTGNATALTITPADGASTNANAQTLNIELVPSTRNTAMFYGQTTGTGSAQNDYAGTVAVKTTAGTGRVPFPQLGPTVGSTPATAINSTSFNLPVVGTYHITGTVHTTLASQVQLELNGTSVDNSTASNQNPTSGGHEHIIDVLLTTTSVNSTLAVINPTGNAAALTITAADANFTHANAQVLVIDLLPAAQNSAMFYGLTAGTGQPTSTDYASTVAARTSAGTGRVPFPRLGPNTGNIVAIDSSSVRIPVTGLYHVTSTIHTTEPGQLQLELNGLAVANSLAPNQNPTSGGHVHVIDAIINVTTANSVLAVINPSGNSPALTITTADGSFTHANAQTLVVEQLSSTAAVTFTTSGNVDVINAGPGTTTIVDVGYPIPRDYDEATDTFALEVEAAMSGSTDTSVTLTAVAYRMRVGDVNAVQVGGTVTGKARGATAATNLTTASQLVVFDFSKNGLKFDDAVTIVVTATAHTTDSVLLYAVIPVYRSTLVSYHESIGGTHDGKDGSFLR